jgi:hypothetical protein
MVLDPERISFMDVLKACKIMYELCPQRVVLSMGCYVIALARLVLSSKMYYILGCPS